MVSLNDNNYSNLVSLKLKKGDTLPYTEILPKIDGSIIKNERNELYTLVHQYDRNEELKQIIENKYKWK